MKKVIETLLLGVVIISLLLGGAEAETLKAQILWSGGWIGLAFLSLAILNIISPEEEKQ